MKKYRLRQLWIYLRPYKQALGLGIAALLAVNLVGVYIPLLLRDSIDKLKIAGSFGDIWPYVWEIALLATVMWGIRMLSRLWIFGIGRQVEFDLKQGIFEHLLTLEPSYFTTNSSGDLISRATSDVDNIRRLVGFAVLSLINTLFAYGLTLPAMLAIHIPLTVAAIAVYPLMLITVQLFSGKLRDQQMKVQENISDLSDLIQEDMSGIALIKIYAQEENERKVFRQKNRNLLQANLQLARTRNFLFPLIEGLSYISLLLLLMLGTRSITNGEITVGDFVALLLLVERLVFPTALLGFTITAYQSGEVSIDRLEAIFEVDPAIKDEHQPIALQKPVQGEIIAKGLSYTYAGSNIPALNNLNFAIAAGETVAIVGTIGSGKSTLANVLPRLLDIGSNQVFLDGQDITHVALDELRQSIAYVPQDSFLFSTTIKNNIRYGDPLNDTPDIEYAAKQAQIHPEILNFPQKYETLVGERGITLSGGQRQRTSLARALLLDAPVLILDDALSSVDNQTATRILESLSDEQGKTVIFISHQLSAAATADRIFVMDKGEIVQMGNHATLLHQTGLYQSLWQQHQLEEILQ
jgi:ATP-binding cassette subfamily B protein